VPPQLPPPPQLRQVSKEAIVQRCLRLQGPQPGAHALPCTAQRGAAGGEAQ
jgi:hypothetical protein